MKKRYIILLSILALEFSVVYVLDALKIQLQTWFGNLIGALCIFIPIELLLLLVSKDESAKPNIRFVSKMVFVFLLLCLISGGIATWFEA